MKTILLLFAANLILLFSCNQRDVKSAEEAPHEHLSAVQAEQSSDDYVIETKKWETDESTRVHVAKLRARVETFKLKKETDLASYNALGTDLSGDLNNLISGCRMKGPAHDALHGWLTPVLDQVAGLKKSATIEQGKLSVAKIEDGLFAFYEQFE